MGVGVIDLESKTDAPHVASAAILGLGALLVATGLVMLLTPSRESEWRSPAREAIGARP